jgi:hypothetical protein
MAGLESKPRASRIFGILLQALGVAAKPCVCPRSALVYGQYNSPDCTVSLLFGFEWVLSV